MAIKVLIIDDSAVIRQVLQQILGSDSRIEVVGTAADPIIAREKIKQLKPDVLTLDIEMPKMDGITFLKNLMRLHPLPVIMISTLTQKGAGVTLDALAIGAVDFVAKPQMSAAQKLIDDYAEDIIEKVITAASSNVKAFDPEEFTSHQKLEPIKQPTNSKPLTYPVIAIGASTGGTEAIKDVLARLPTSFPPIIITQHIPVEFSESYAQRLNKNCELTVHHVTSPMPLSPGNAYLAPGDKHLLVTKERGQYYCQLSDGPKVNRHKPSVEVMFDSALNLFGEKLVGLMLTGMGADGAESMLRMHEKGCHTIAQSEKTSVVWGMPGAAVALNAVDKVLDLNEIALYLGNYIKKF